MHVVRAEEQMMHFARRAHAAAHINLQPCVGHDNASGSAFARAEDLEIQAQRAAAVA